MTITLSVSKRRVLRIGVEFHVNNLEREYSCIVMNVSFEALNSETCERELL